MAYGPELFVIEDIHTLAPGVTVVGQTVELLNVAGSGTNLFTQSSICTVSSTYKIEFQISDRVDGGVQIIAPFPTTTVSTEELHSYEDVSAEVFFRMRCSSSAAGTMTLSNISIKEVLPDPTTTVEVTWIDSISAAATGNKIYRDDVEIADIANGIQFYSDATAETGTTYKYEVQAYSATEETTQEVTGVNTDTITTS